MMWSVECLRPRRAGSKNKTCVHTLGNVNLRKRSGFEPHWRHIDKHICTTLTSSLFLTPVGIPARQQGWQKRHHWESEPLQQSPQ